MSSQVQIDMIETADETRVGQAPVVLSLVSVSKSYPGVRALSDVDLTLHAGEVRKSPRKRGGKTTLISIVNGTVTPDSGTMFVRSAPFKFGSPRASAEAGISTVYQEQSLVTSMPVYENMLLGREDAYTSAGVTHPKRCGFARKQCLMILKSPLMPAHTPVRSRSANASRSRSPGRSWRANAAASAHLSAR